MVGDDQLTKLGGDGSSGNRKKNKVISRWGDLENNRSAKPQKMVGVSGDDETGKAESVVLDKQNTKLHGAVFVSDPNKVLKSRTFVRKTGVKKAETYAIDTKNSTVKAIPHANKVGLKTAKSAGKTAVKSTKKKITHLSAGTKRAQARTAKKKTKAKGLKKLKQDKILIVVWILVFAVVAVILALVLGVFLPKVQKEGREDARIQDMVRVSNAVVLYQRDHSTNRSNLPAAGSWVGVARFPKNCSLNSACDFVQKYLNGDAVNGLTENYVDDYENRFKDPDGAYYNLVITENLATTKNISKVFELETEETVEGSVEDTEESSEAEDGSEVEAVDEEATSENEDGGEIQSSSLKEALSRKESLSYTGEGYEFVPAHDWRGETVGLSHTIYIVPGAKCRGELIVKATKSSFAVVYNLENGARCLSNN